ncbi:glycine betaine ABC transporter substrate-binding protein [Miltoncostaea marina]|uniref:ABC transporter substrate-binding protein n=1 Tax=Miltoncostaea marina TaxID=2843215 RepID=UPI001C3D34E0|nr:glycine betaine ABC transporter substrate-binding protein [Miltoncostaea marina]
MTPRLRRLTAAALAVLLATAALAAAGCGDDEGDDEATGAGGGAAVTIADKGFAESFIVAQAYAQALDGQGFDADVTSLASTEIADRAVRDGEIDAYPEYVGTAWQTVLGLDAAAAPATREAQFQQVAERYTGRGLTALPPAPFNNGNAVACTQEAVDANDITTLSDLGRASSKLVYSANAEHLTRADGLPLLKREYGIDFKDVKTVDISLRYKPIEDGQADCVYAFGTDPKLGQLDLVLIEDDKGTYSAGLSYQTFPVVSSAFLEGLSAEQRTAFEDTLGRVNAALTQEAIIPLISRVEFDQEDPEVIAGEFLSEAGITEG